MHILIPDRDEQPKTVTTDENCTFSVKGITGFDAKRREKEPSRRYIPFPGKPKQKIKKLGADKRQNLCYTIKTDVISILFCQGGAFL